MATNMYPTLRTAKNAVQRCSKIRAGDYVIIHDSYLANRNRPAFFPMYARFAGPWLDDPQYSIVASFYAS